MADQDDNKQAVKQLKEDRKSAKELLAALEVKSVIVVDDDAVPGPELLLLAIKLGEAGPLLEELNLEVEDLSDEERDLEVREYFARLGSDEKRETLNGEALKRIGVPSADIGELDMLRYLLGDSPNKIIKPETWTQDRDWLIANAGGIDRLLVLFDLNLGPGAATRGADLLEQHLCGENAARAAILTGQVESGSELDEHERIFGDRPGLAGRALLTSKQSLTGPKARDFLNILRLTANAPRLHEMRTRYVELACRTHAAAMKHLIGLNPRVFEDVVFRSSGAEGTWELDTLQRVTQLMQSEAARKELAATTDGKEIISRLDSARELVDIAFVPHEPSAVEGRRLMDAERWTRASYINELGVPLANGDVFEIGKDRTNYILMCQPCDLALRSDGKRRVTESVTLAALENRRHDEDRGARRVHALPEGFPEPIGPLDMALSRGVELPVDVLDLCTLTRDGKASWCANESERPTALTVGTRPRRKELDKAMRRTAKLVEACQGLSGDEADEVRSRILGVTTRRHPAVDSETLTAGRIDYDCRRVARLAQPYAEAALTALAAELARQAHEHQLDRFTSKPPKAPDALEHPPAP